MLISIFQQGSDGPVGPRGQPGEPVSDQANTHTHARALKHTYRSLTSHGRLRVPPREQAD